ncbi:E3 ubiquitin-protein ligase RING1-like [Linum perenne]
MDFIPLSGGFLSPGLSDLEVVTPPRSSQLSSPIVPLAPLPRPRFAEPGPTLLNPIQLFPEEAEWEPAPEHHHEFRTNPASESAIEDLERVERGTDLEEGEDLCVICQEEMDGGRLIKLKCKHLFHESCCTLWLRTSNFCPLCRHQMKTGRMEADEIEVLFCRWKLGEWRLIKLKCEHLFHESCCTSWLRTSNFCPLCCEFVLQMEEAIKVEDHEELTCWRN